MNVVLSKSWPFLVLLAVWLFAFIGLRHRRIRTEARRDVQLALLSKFQTGEEITKFLATEEGKRLLDQMAGPQSDARHQATGLMVSGSILSSIAIGLALGWTFLGEPDLIAAIVIGSVGVGLFVAAALTYRLVRKFGPIREGE